MANRVAAAARRIFIGHTTLVAYLALLLASSSAVYAAATIGSAEVINNSLQSIDLKDGAAVTGADIVNDSVAGADVNEATLNGVGRRLQYSAAASAASQPPRTTLATVAGYTFKAACFYGGSSGSVHLALYVHGPAGDYQLHKLRSFNDSPASSANHVYFSGGLQFAANTDVGIWSGGAPQSSFERSVGTVWVHSGSTLLHVDVHAFADWRQGGDTGECTLYGMVTRGV